MKQLNHASRSRALALAAALAIAGIAGAQTTGYTPSKTVPPQAPCGGLQGNALNDCLKQQGDRPPNADGNPGATMPAPTGTSNTNPSKSRAKTGAANGSHSLPADPKSNPSVQTYPPSDISGQGQAPRSPQAASGDVQIRPTIPPGTNAK